MVNIDKIKNLCRLKGITQTFICKKLDKRATFLGDVSRGKDRIDDNEAHQIADILGTTYEYLTDKTDDPSPKENNGATTQFVNLFPIKKKKIPVLGNIACGEPILINREYDEYITVPEDLDADFCLIAKGDSMINVGVHDGTKVFIKQMDMVDNGKIAAVAIDEDVTTSEITLKRFYYDREKNIVTLVAENPAYPPLVYSGRDIEKIRVVGLAYAMMVVLK